MKPLCDSVIIVCGIVRNAEKGLRKNIPVINRLCDCARDYSIVIFENNSTDGTKRLLRQWALEKGDRAHISIEDFPPTAPVPVTAGVNPFYSSVRISRMVRLRNRYMDFIIENGMKADYLIAVDLDVASIDFRGVLSSFSTPFDWDAVTAYGHSLSPSMRERYHDTYALCPIDDDGPQTERKILENADRFSARKAGERMVRVKSAFGGLAIYRFEAVDGLRYQLTKNDDPRVEVECEHYSVYRQMRERGFERVYINYSMAIKYQKLSLKIVWNSICRRIGR